VKCIISCNLSRSMHLHYILFCVERFVMVLQKRINIEYVLFSVHSHSIKYASIFTWPWCSILVQSSNSRHAPTTHLMLPLMLNLSMWFFLHTLLYATISSKRYHWVRFLYYKKLKPLKKKVNLVLNLFY